MFNINTPSLLLLLSRQYPHTVTSNKLIHRGGIRCTVEMHFQVLKLRFSIQTGLLLKKTTEEISLNEIIHYQSLVSEFKLKWPVIQHWFCWLTFDVFNQQKKKIKSKPSVIIRNELVLQNRNLIGIESRKSSSSKIIRNRKYWEN